MRSWPEIPKTQQINWNTAILFQAAAQRDGTTKEEVDPQDPIPTRPHPTHHLVNKP